MTVEAAATWLNQNSGAIVAVATTIYVGAAIAQWIAIRTQAALAAQSNAVATRAFVLSQRPRLIVRNVVIKRPRPIHEAAPLETFEEHHLVSGQLYVVNVGGTTAHIKDAGCWVLWTQEGLPMERPYEGKDGNVALSTTIQIAPGQSIALPFVSDRPMGDMALWIAAGQRMVYPTGLQARQWKLYVLGWIEYADDLGHVRRTAFCRRFLGYLEKWKRRFVPVKRRDYEHAE